MTVQALTGGFTQAPQQAAQAFRAILESLARPGKISTLRGAQPPAPLSIAAGTALLTLTDGTTPLHLAGALDCAPVRDWVAFHIGAPLVTAQSAAFAVGTWADLMPLDRFPIGAPDYPDRSATLIVLVDDLSNDGARLTGPGIAKQARLSLPDVAAVQANAARFPLGLDFLFTAGDRIAGLPRSTKVEDV